MEPDEIEDPGFGLRTTLEVPGADPMLLYEPRHAIAPSCSGSRALPTDVGQLVGCRARTEHEARSHVRRGLTGGDLLSFDIIEYQMPRDRRAQPTARPTAALFTRIPKEQAERLDHAASLLRRPKQEIVAQLIARHLDVPPSVDTAGGGGQESGSPVGHYSFRATPEDGVLTVEQLAELLQVRDDDVRTAAEAGELPGRKIGGHWRFSRQAVLDWLATPSERLGPRRTQIVER